MTIHLFEHHFLRVAMHFEQNYQGLWQNHVETKRPNDGVVYDESEINLN